MWGIWLVALPALAQDWRWSCDHEYCGVTLERLLEAPQVWVAEVEAYDVNSNLPFVERSVATLHILEVIQGGVDSDRIGLGQVDLIPPGCGLGSRVLAFAKPMTIPVCAAGSCEDVVVGDFAIRAESVLQPLLWEGPDGSIRRDGKWGALCFNGVDFNHKVVGPERSCPQPYDATFDDLVGVLRKAAGDPRPEGERLPGHGGQP